MTKIRLVTIVTSLVLLSACNPKEKLICPQGETDCSGSCVPLLTDRHNCGACGVALGPLQICVAGTPACAADVGTCAGACTDLARDPDHCGACETACDAGEFCTTLGGGTCTTTGACPDGFTACGRACVILDSDRFHCGACGAACAAGEACRAGACRADVYAACINTNEVVPLTLELAPAGDPWEVPAGPTALAVFDGVLFSANGWPAASLSILPLDRSHVATNVRLFGTDLQNVIVHDNAVLVSNAESGSVVILAPGGAILGEIPMPEQQYAPNPHGIAVTGTTAYVALYGTQKIALLDISALSSCAAPDPGAPACGGGSACPAGRRCVSGTCRRVCGTVAGEIDLASIDGASDPPGLPTPSDVVVTAGRVFVGLSNLADDPSDPWPFWVVPSGPGKLAVVDPASNAVSLLALGTDCKKPGPLAVHGSTLWVGCGSLSFPEIAPGTLVPIDLSQGIPSVGAAIDISPVVPGALAFCGGIGYVADQGSGEVLTFNPDASAKGSAVTVCPTGPWGYTAVADITCSD